MADLCEVAFIERELRTGQQRRGFLMDPTHEHVFHFTPTHGSWLNQVELWFSPRPQQFERFRYPPRPYHRKPKKTG
jgi:hypothetical protein